MWALEKMVQVNLFAGQEWRHRHREWTCGHGGEGEGGTNRETGTDVCSLPRVKELLVRTCHIAQRAQLGALR